MGVLRRLLKELLQKDLQRLLFWCPSDLLRLSQIRHQLVTQLEELTSSQRAAGLEDGAGSMEDVLGKQSDPGSAAYSTIG